MAITPRVRKQMFRAAAAADACELIRLPPTRPQPLSPTASNMAGPAWTPAEHERFLEALELFPSGPWRRIAEYVGSKTARQTMTHAQKYRQKIARRERGLRVGAPPRKLLATGGTCATGGDGNGDSTSGSASFRCRAAGGSDDGLAVRLRDRERRLLPLPAPPSSSSPSPSFSPSSPSEPDISTASAMLLENVVLDALLAEAEFLEVSPCGSLFCQDDVGSGGCSSLYAELICDVDSLASDQQLIGALLDDVAVCLAPPPSPPSFGPLNAFACAPNVAATQDFDMSNSFCGVALDELVVECGDDILLWLGE